jgi:putative membrane protein
LRVEGRDRPSFSLPRPGAAQRARACHAAHVNVVADILVGLVAALHLYFLVLEMFLWTTPTGRRVFGLEPAFAEESKSLAANQGLYNGFLVAGLVWGLAADRNDVKIFFLACVIVAGLYGAATVNRRILFVQAVPAVLALVAVLVSR